MIEMTSDVKNSPFSRRLRRLLRATSSENIRTPPSQLRHDGQDAPIELLLCLVRHVAPQLVEEHAVLNEENTLAVARRVAVVRDHEDGLAAAVDLLEQAQQLIRRARIERAGRLIGKQNFRVIEEVAVGKVFFNWIFGFEGKVRIKAPADVKEQYRQMVENAAKVL